MRRRAINAARIRRIEAARRSSEESAPVADLSDSLLAGSIYALQTRNREGRWSARIRELMAEQTRRREEEAR